MSEQEEQSHQQLNIKKVHYFLQKNDQEKPNLPSQIGIMQLLRQYLNDDDFHISYRDHSVFKLEQYEGKLQELYQNWKQQVKGELNIDQFISHWIKKEDELDVTYTLYQDMTEDQRIYQASNVLTRKDQNMVKKGSYKIVVRNQNQIAYNIKDKIKSPSRVSLDLLNKQSLQPSDYLKKFFTIYSKQTNSVNNATFNQYQKHYNSINLTKWMHFVRDIGISAYSKIMNPKKMKEVFMKFQSKDKVLIFETFEAAVNELMKLLLGQDKQKIVNEGYQLLGIKNRNSFEEKFKQMGMLVPIFTRVNFDMRGSQADTIISKVSLMKDNSYRLKANKSVQIQKPRETINHILSSSSRNLPKINIHPKIFTSQKSRSHIVLAEENKCGHLSLAPQLQQSRLTKVTARHRRPPYNQALVQQIMKQQEDDPYLKRYNSKQNIKYHCIANRIDQRIQKIMNKYEQV